MQHMGIFKMNAQPVTTSSTTPATTTNTTTPATPSANKPQLQAVTPSAPKPATSTTTPAKAKAPQRKAAAKRKPAAKKAVTKTPAKTTAKKPAAAKKPVAKKTATKPAAKTTARKTTRAASSRSKTRVAATPRPAAARKSPSRSTARRSTKAVKTATATAKKVIDQTATAASRNPFTNTNTAWNSDSWANATKELFSMKSPNQAYNMDQFSQVGMKQMEDLVSASKQNVDAFVKSFTIVGKGMEDMVKTYISKTQNTNEKGAAAFKSLIACKTINEFAEVQNKLVQEGFEDAMNTAAALSEMTVKVMMDAAEPLNTQVTKAMKKANVA